MAKPEIRRCLTIDGVRLDLIAIDAGPDGWELAVENELGVRSQWFEFFPSAQAAFERGAAAIAEEGVETFVDVEGFEYLRELQPAARRKTRRKRH